MKRNEKCCYREVLEQWQARAAHWASRFCENREIFRLYLLDSNARRERESENITILELLRKKKILHTLASSLTCSCFCCTKIAKRACWSFFFAFRPRSRLRKGFTEPQTLTSYSARVPPSEASLTLRKRTENLWGNDAGLG